MTQRRKTTLFQNLIFLTKLFRHKNHQNRQKYMFRHKHVGK